MALWPRGVESNGALFPRVAQLVRVCGRRDGCDVGGSSPSPGTELNLVDADYLPGSELAEVELEYSADMLLADGLEAGVVVTSELHTGRG